MGSEKLRSWRRCVKPSGVVDGMVAVVKVAGRWGGCDKSAKLWWKWRDFFWVWKWLGEKNMRLSHMTWPWHKGTSTWILLSPQCLVHLKERHSPTSPTAGSSSRSTQKQSNLVILKTKQCWKKTWGNLLQKQWTFLKFLLPGPRSLSWFLAFCWGIIGEEAQISRPGRNHVKFHQVLCSCGFLSFREYNSFIKEIKTLIIFHGTFWIRTRWF